MAYDEHAGGEDYPEEDHLEHDIKTMTGLAMGLWYIGKLESVPWWAT